LSKLKTVIEQLYVNTTCPDLFFKKTYVIITRVKCSITQCLINPNNQKTSCIKKTLEMYLFYAQYHCFSQPQKEMI